MVKGQIAHYWRICSWALSFMQHRPNSERKMTVYCVAKGLQGYSSLKKHLFKTFWSGMEMPLAFSICWITGKKSSQFFQGWRTSNQFISFDLGIANSLGSFFKNVILLKKCPWLGKVWHYFVPDLSPVLISLYLLSVVMTAPYLQVEGQVSCFLWQGCQGCFVSRTCCRTFYEQFSLHFLPGVWTHHCPDMLSFSGLGSGIICPPLVFSQLYCQCGVRFVLFSGLNKVVYWY